MSSRPLTVTKATPAPTSSASTGKGRKRKSPSSSSNNKSTSKKKEQQSKSQSEKLSQQSQPFITKPSKSQPKSTSTSTSTKPSNKPSSDDLEQNWDTTDADDLIINTAEGSENEDDDVADGVEEIQPPQEKKQKILTEEQRAKKKAKFKALKEKAKAKATSTSTSTSMDTEIASIELQLLTPSEQAHVMWHLITHHNTMKNAISDMEKETSALQATHFLTMPSASTPTSHVIPNITPTIRKIYPHFAKELCTPPKIPNKKIDKKIKKGEKKEDETEVKEEKEEIEETTKIDKKDVVTGAPYLLVISPSALRAVEFVKSFHSLGLKTRISKLFARHIKIDEQTEELQSNDIRVAVGTPNRVLKLCQSGALNLERCKVVIVDTGRDIKNFNLFTLASISDDFVQLYYTYFHPRVLGMKTKLLLF